MEESPATYFVDFANQDLHIGRYFIPLWFWAIKLIITLFWCSIIPSCTQEEILFSCCPEAFPGILFCPRMKRDEIIVINNLRRFSDYSGYLHNFQFVGNYPTLKLTHALALDACMSSHFRESNVLRDLNKVIFLSQSFARTLSISDSVVQ